MNPEQSQSMREHTSAAEGEVLERERKFHQAIEWTQREENLKQLVLQAFGRRLDAYQWRAFRVGCVVVGTVGKDTNLGVDVSNIYATEPQVDLFKTDPNPNIDVTHGPNNTPVELVPPATGDKKRCAERNALQIAVEHKKDELIAGIITESDKTDTSTNERNSHDVLHPCAECTIYIKDLVNKGKIRLETILVNANYGDADSIDTAENRDPIFEIHTVGDFLNLYEAKS